LPAGETGHKIRRRYSGAGMESGRVLEGSASADKSSRDDHVDIPTYVETGVPAGGLSNRQKLLYHGSGIGVGLLMAALAFAGWRYFDQDAATTAPPSISRQTANNIPADMSAPVEADNGENSTTTEETPSTRTHAHRAKANPGADVIAAAKPATGLMYVHRNNSDLRPAPSTSSEPLKKLAKGEKVQLLMLSDKWAQVDDAGTKGWMRASVLKDTPPGEKKSRKKKSDGE
jgi:Bacterial SH3 domain